LGSDHKTSERADFFFKDKFILGSEADQQF
jgi:hypothetical protein